MQTKKHAVDLAVCSNVKADVGCRRSKGKERNGEGVVKVSEEVVRKEISPRELGGT